MSLWIRAKIVFWFPTTFPLFISCSPLLYYHIKSGTQNSLKPLWRFATISFRFKRHILISFIVLLWYLRSLLLFSFPSTPTNHGTSFYWCARVKQHIWSQPCNDNTLRKCNKNELISCALQHWPAPCRAVPEMDFDFKHCSNKENCNCDKSRGMYSIKAV